ncbi:MAG: hypothetical protein K2X27_11585 [Candidatus Obscuribacterales bacterium]|nr:hypothetical protein [Candidatus Obscuribacterales bacterium]
MTEKSAATAVTHVRRLSWRAQLKESRAFFACFLLFFFMGLFSGLFTALTTPFFQFFMPLGLPVYFITGLLFSISVVYSLRFVDRKFFGAMKYGILAVEDRVISGDCRTQTADLEKLVAGYLKLKRLEAADFYSKKLLEASNCGGNSPLKLSDWMITTEAWVSSQDYIKSWNYKLLWLFETRGVLTLSPDKIDFKSAKINFTCHPSHIVELEIKRHPLWLKPIPYRYIAITINEFGQRQKFILTPSFAQTDTVFDGNKLVDVWYERLKKLKNKTNPSAGLPDWMRDLHN